MQKDIKIFFSEDWRSDPEYAREGYELLDTGGGEKLERFGPYIFARPCEGAVWDKTLKKEWHRPDGRFISSTKDKKSGWQLSPRIRQSWTMSYKSIVWKAIPTPFRHLAFFPEQVSHWDFIEARIRRTGRPIRFLNLFGYTGVASLFALRAGAAVTHLDASKQSLDLAKENQRLNAPLAALPMRVILDDAVKFLEREGKRGNTYDAIIMDPPKFGRGPKGEVWKIEEKLPKLLALARKVLSDRPLFVILTSYATDSSSLSLGYALTEAMKGLDGSTAQGELCVPETSTGRFISLANTAVWESR